MVSVNSIDSFIEKSSALLMARPSSTKISTRYSHKTSTLPALVFVKAYDPISGTCFTFKLTKINELSRIWSALGPRGVEMSKQTKEGSVVSVKQRGIASIMSGVNVEYVEANTVINTESDVSVPSQTVESASITADKENTSTKTDASKSKKKRKGKK